MGLAPEVNKMLKQYIEPYVTVEEILTIFDRITSQMDYTKKITSRNQSVISATISVLKLLPPYHLDYNWYTIVQYHYNRYSEILK